MSAYAPFDPHLPTLAGRWLAAVARAIEQPLLGPQILRRMLADSGVAAARAVAAVEPPTATPRWPPPVELAAAPPAAGFLAAPPGVAPARLPVARARDFHLRYLARELSPEAVAERVLAGIAALDRLEPPLRAFVSVDPEDVRRQARAATLRFGEGRSLGVLDGVPVAIKDELDQAPHPTRGGTTFLGRAPAARDATVVARLRAAGALLIGKTNMHEIGIQPNGFNAHHGQVRNPFDRGCDPGGSSSGSAAAVAAGLCPIAIGADGGGSVRVPAALCGAVGLKATFGRVSEHGALPLCWSVAHIGPIAASVEDAALAYAAIAGPDPHDPLSRAQPAPSLAGFGNPDLGGVRIGLFRAWFEHAEPEIVGACDAAVARLVGLGAKLVELEIPELEQLRAAHTLTILAEFAAGLEPEPESPGAHAASVRVLLGVARRLRAVDYLWAQRVRTRQLALWDELLRKVDLIVTPATAVTAPRLPTSIPPEGFSDVTATLAVMRFTVAGNLLGLPALVLPVGYAAHGLPIGLQLYARAWNEALLLRTGRLLEAEIERRRPETFVDLLA